MKTIAQIRQTPLTQRTVLEEYALARHEKRQPYCVYCGKPLELSQTQYVYLFWYWDRKKKLYVKNDNDGDADKAFCIRCQRTDHDFVDMKTVRF